MEAHKGMLWDFYVAVLLALGPPVVPVPPRPPARPREEADWYRSQFMQMAMQVEFLKTTNLAAIYDDFLWVSRNGALEDWKPKPIDTHNQPI